MGRLICRLYYVAFIMSLVLCRLYYVAPPELFRSESVNIDCSPSEAERSPSEAECTPSGAECTPSEAEVCTPSEADVCTPSEAEGWDCYYDAAPMGLLYPERSRGVGPYTGFSSRLRSTNSLLVRSRFILRAKPRRHSSFHSAQSGLI
jgi:hypothetical protein